MLRIVSAKGTCVMAKAYKNAKRGNGQRFVKLEHWFLSTDAWRTMKPGPRILYVELKHRFNGSNNGVISLSHRDAEKLLATGRNAIGRWYKELEERGFIKMTKGPHLGPNGVGMAAQWALSWLR